MAVENREGKIEAEKISRQPVLDLKGEKYIAGQRPVREVMMDYINKRKP